MEPSHVPMFAVRRPEGRGRAVTAILCALGGLAAGALVGAAQAEGWEHLLPVAHAEVRDEAPRGRVVAPVGDEALAIGVRRLLPRMVARHADAVNDGALTRALARALAQASPAVRAAYGDAPHAALTEPGGLSEGGRAALRWIADAPAHGVTGLDGTAAELERLVLALPRAPEVKVPDGDLHADVLASTWRAAGHEERPLAAAAAHLAAEVPEVGRAAERLVRHGAQRAEDRAALEVALADALARLAAALTHRPRTEVVLADEKGRYLPPDALWKREEPALDEDEAAALLRAAAAGEEALDAWMEARLPPVPEYHALVEATRRYAALCEDGGWEPVPRPRVPRGPAWTDEDGIRAVQARLAREGFYAGEPTGVYDDATVKAMKRYQRQRQVTATGSFTEDTAAEMNVPCEDRLATLRLNLARWRHTARRGEDTFVAVNLAGQEARFVSEGREVIRKRTVVGSGRWFWHKEDERRVYPKASPILHDHIDQVVVNPSWTVPNSIYVLEMKPRIAKDPDYLAKKGYELVTTPSGVEMVVEPPGPRNTLGRVKMLFPNSESIYLHDTNQRSLFSKPRRAFSHGCIRVKDALDFATALLVEDRRRDGEGFPERRLHQLARGTVDVRSSWFKLSHPVPVFLEYYTATVRPDGLVAFHPDIYDYDLRVALGHELTRRESGR